MNCKLTLKIITLISVLFVGALRPVGEFYPKAQIAPSLFYSKKLIEYKMRKLHLLLQDPSYLQQINKMNLLNPNSLFLEQFEPTFTKTENTVAKILRKGFLSKLGSGLNAITMPFRRGIGKGFENLTSNLTNKIAYKGIILGIGCLGYWTFWGKQNERSFFFPMTTAYQLIKKFIVQNKNEIKPDSFARKYEAVLKKIGGWFGGNNNESTGSEDTNLQSGLKASLEDKGVALAFLLLANFFL